MSDKEYDPLDYENLTINLVRELMSRGPWPLPLTESFTGPGVYALFYRGSFPVYASVRSETSDHPIYVGKAVPPGARKGARSTEDAKTLFGRIVEHSQSIQAARNLSIEDFTCRFLIVVPLWITMAERFLIEHYRPLWNACLDGFGLHDPGKGRHAGEASWWDTLHPGRGWATRLQQTKTAAQAEERVRNFTNPPSE